MVVWFVAIAVLGMVNIWKAPAIAEALNPLEAARFLTADPALSVAVTGAVFLALTGGEALYADMGPRRRRGNPTGVVQLGPAGASAVLFRPGRVGVN
jgi:K+ transporter